jgi:hypothetical protein
MRLTTRRAAAPVAIAVASILTLAACGGGDEDPATPEGGDTPTEPAPETEETESEEAPEETTSDDADETASDDAESESGDAESESGDADDAGASADGAAPWANPVTTDGESLGTIELGDVTVEAFLVTTDVSTRSSIWADPDTDEPIVNEGDPVVVINYVVTNNGEPVNLSYGLVDVGLNYDSWPFMQQPSVADSTLMESVGVNDNGVNGDSLGEDVYTLGTGESYSVAEVMLHQPGEAYTIEAEFEARDDAGERNGNEFEGEITGTMN